MSGYEPILKSIRILNDAYIHSLNSDAPQVEQPTEIKVSLRPHQKSILYRMEEQEKKLSVGLDGSGTKIYSRFSFLGDGVGVGKSLMVLGHIARLKSLEKLPSIPSLDSYSTSQLYSLRYEEFGKDSQEIGCLIVVPHTLYRQWQEYIKLQTSLQFLGIQAKKVMEANDFEQKLKSADVVLVSNTLYGGLQAFVDQKKLFWKRVFFDEADTLYLPSTRPKAITRFTWLISASWANLLFPNACHYINTSTMNELLQDRHFPVDRDLKKVLQTNYTQHNTSTYSYMRYMVISSTFFKDFIHTGNAMRGNLVLRCREDYVKESITLPPISIRNILCRPSILHHVVQNAISADVRTLLHAGDIQGALERLGVKEEEPMSLVRAVTENRNKELDRLKKTYDFKSSLEYSTPQAKEQALKSLKDRIQSLEEQISGLKSRIENYKDEMCPICFDEPQNPSLTPCCGRIFCAGCILTSLTRQPTCPLCRANIHASGLRNLATRPIEERPSQEEEQPIAQPLKKNEQLVDILKKNPNGRFLVFSRYDNPFIQIQQEIEQMNFTVKQVRGNKDVIASTLKSFQGGQTKVLLLNSLQAGAGLNITAATHVILLHAMTHEEEKQILGRAYRLGRTAPLDVIRLLHPDEMVHTHQQATA
jgi:hypothetical protein